MALHKHGRFYWLDVWVEKKRYRRSLKTDNYFEALDQAKRVLGKLKAAARKDDILFSEFCRRYLDYAWSTKPASAIMEAQRLPKIQAFFEASGITLLSEVTPYHIEQLRAWLKERKDDPVKEGKKRKPDRSKATLNRYLQLLRGMFYRAMDWGLYPGPNPLRKVKFFRESSPVKPLSEAELEKVLEAARAISDKPASPLQKAFYDLVQFALNTGLRKAELLGLRWHDIKDGEIVVRGKGDKIREVPLNQAAQAVLARQARRSEFVFYIPNRDRPGLFRRTTALISKRAGVPFHFHLLRHFFATALLEKGADLVTVSELLGHSSSMTSLLYTHTDPDRKRRAVELMDRTGGPIVGRLTQKTRRD